VTVEQHRQASCDAKILPGSKHCAGLEHWFSNGRSTSTVPERTIRCL